MRPRMIVPIALAMLVAAPAAGGELVPLPELDSLYRLKEGETRAVNALWIENPKELQFGAGRTSVVIADLKGPGVITMIHIDRPSIDVYRPTSMRASRDTVLRICWDGEKTPSVEAPLVDFFCDPNGALDRMESALVAVKRGWNCYFPMPFAKSARVELSVDDPRYPSQLWHTSPAYSYVMYRKLGSLPPDAAYFHAVWRQKTLLLGKEEYQVLEAEGRGQFIGWNLTVRNLAPHFPNIYPVDENEKFYVDGEKEPFIESQGLECAFGFGWGFPEQAHLLPYYGYQPYYNGAAVYRFMLGDCVSFKKSLRLTVGFGTNESPFFRATYSKPENPLQFSSVAYWYQKEPHKPFPALPPRPERRPAPGAVEAKKYRDAGETLVLRCGSPKGDEEFLEEGWDFVFKKGLSSAAWPGEINHCWADNDSLEFEILCPKGASGTLRLFIIDPDSFGGGRKQSVAVAGRPLGEYEKFQAGLWLEIPVSASDTANGRLPVVIKNLKPGSNAVTSLVRFVARASSR